MRKLNLKYVSEAIGSDYKEWNKGDVVKIKAQTGTGKTFFIIGDEKTNGLIDNMKDGEQLLYICNRRALKREIKLDLLKKLGMDVPRVKKTGKVNMSKIDELKTIKNITVLSYQELSSMFMKNKYIDTNYDLHEFDYIVCDECHFFLTDSGFNNKTYFTFFDLVRDTYPNSIRIFISATMDEVSTAINKALEDMNESQPGQYKLWGNKDGYNTGFDYSYLNVKYFNKIDDIAKLINNDKLNEKWLVFVKSEDDGNSIKQDLLDMDIDAEFIVARDNNEEKINISDNNKFNCRVLISTKVLDNGVNIKDDELCNIVIMAYDKTTFIQELGRLRIDILDAKNVNLYIPMFSKKVFEGKINRNYEPKLEAIKLLSEDKNKFLLRYANDLRSLPNDIFYLSESESMELNLLGASRLQNDYNFAYDMSAKLNNDKFAYVKEQLKWLGLEDTFNEENLIEMVVDDEVMENLESFLTNAYNNDERFTKQFFLEKMDEFIESDYTLIEILNKLDGGNSRNKGMKLLNKLFNDIGLDLIVSSKPIEEKVNGKRKKVTYWIVSRIE